jgi:hypothetical protein
LDQPLPPLSIELFAIPPPVIARQARSARASAGTEMADSRRSAAHLGPEAAFEAPARALPTRFATPA